MDYLIVFIGGFLVGSIMALVRGAKWMKFAAVKQLRKELNLPESSPLGGEVDTNPKAMADSYDKAIKDRANYKPRTMWGPKGEEKKLVCKWCRQEQSTHTDALCKCGGEYEVALPRGTGRG